MCCHHRHLILIPFFLAFSLLSRYHRPLQFQLGCFALLIGLRLKVHPRAEAGCALLNAERAEELLEVHRFQRRKIIQSHHPSNFLVVGWGGLGVYLFRRGRLLGALLISLNQHRLSISCLEWVGLGWVYLRMNEFLPDCSGTGSLPRIGAPLTFLRTERMICCSRIGVSTSSTPGGDIICASPSSSSSIRCDDCRLGGVGGASRKSLILYDMFELASITN